MKSHKYCSLGALFCMLGCIYSGHKLVSPKKKKITESNNSEIS